MASTPVTLLSKRSGNSSDRPFGTTVQVGELAINFAAAENGLYFKDSAGDIRKVTGVHYGSSAPNSTPAGETGNSVGEIWVDSGSNNFLRVWDGSQFIKIGAAFADVAASANVTIASGAIVANSAVIASGVHITTISGAFPPVPVTGVFGYRVDPPSGLYVSFGGGWVPAA